MSGESRIAEELSELRLPCEFLRIEGLGGEYAVVFDYPVKNGRFEDETLKVGVAFQESAYPEYPPHFVWTADLPREPRIPVHSSRDHDGVRWAAFSVPPSDFWDRLPSAEKNMRTYLKRHMTRFWQQV